MLLTPIKNLLSRHYSLSQVLGSQEKRARRISNTLSELRTQLTPQLAKSGSGVAGSAGQQGAAAGVSGYTIVEVMIVLAVSGMLLGSALLLFRGTGQRTQFEQAVNDFSSKLDSSIEAVNNELFPDSDRYKCNAGPSLTLLTEGSQEQSTNQECVYLGRVFHVTPGSSSMRIYTLVGNRLCDGSSPSCPAGQLASNLPDTKPKIANLAVGGGQLSDNTLTETYKLNTSAITLRSAHANSDSTEADVAGFYNGIGATAQTSANSGALNVLSRSYAYDGRSLDGTTLNACIVGDIFAPTKCAKASELKKWELCFVSTDNSNLTALVTLTATANAANTTVKLKGC